MLAMQTLFPQPHPAVPAASPGRTVTVAVNANVFGVFDYLWPDAFGEPVIGGRVRVPFGRGNRKQIGFVLAAFGRYS